MDRLSRSKDADEISDVERLPFGAEVAIAEFSVRDSAGLEDGRHPV